MYVYIYIYLHIYDTVLTLHEYFKDQIIKFHVILMYIFCCKFDGRKPDVNSMWFLLTNYWWTENLLLLWRFFWNEISTCFLQSNYNGTKLNVVLMYFFDANFDRPEINATSAYFFVLFFKRKKYHCPFDISLWYIFDNIKDEGRLNVSPKRIFIFVTLLSTNIFITNYLQLGRYPKTRTTMERSKFSNVRVFLNFWVIYSEKKSQLLRVLTWMKFTCSCFSNIQIDEQI